MPTSEVEQHGRPAALFVIQIRLSHVILLISTLSRVVSSNLIGSGARACTPTIVPAMATSSPFCVNVADPLAWLPHRRWHGAADATAPVGLAAIRTATEQPSCVRRRSEPPGRRTAISCEH